MLTLAGIPLLLDYPGRDEEMKVRTFMERYISSSSYLPWLRSSWPGNGLLGLTYPTGYRNENSWKLNRFYWPTGASRWAYGHFLCGSDGVAEIIGKAYSDTGEYNPIPFALGNPETNGEELFTDVFLLPPTPLSGIRGLKGQAQSLYLLSIVDERWLWWQQDTGNLKIENDTSWIRLYQSLWDMLTVVDFKFDAVPVPYLSPSSAFQLAYQPIPPVLDAIAFNIGHKITINFDGSVESRNAENSLKSLNQDFSDHAGRIVLAGSPNRLPDPL
jgi:hypothetical protein